MRSTLFVLAALALSAGGCSEGPVIMITASYSGANARIVAETVAAPIEQQVNGVENMTSLESESRNDGSYVACVKFRPNTDPDLALVLVQNRVALAKAVLPDVVWRDGVTVAKTVVTKSDKRVAIAVYDRGQHGHDALRQLAEAVVKRLSADGAIVNPEVFPGPDEEQVCVHIDRARCTERGVSLDEVFKVIQAAGAGKKLDTLRALNVTSAKGESIPLDALANLESANGPSGVYRVDMYPAVRIVGVPPKQRSTVAAASRCAELADAERKSQADSDDFAVINLTAR